MKQQCQILGYVVEAVKRYFIMFTRLSKFFFLKDQLDLANDGINDLLWYVSLTGEVRIGYEFGNFFVIKSMSVHTLMCNLPILSS